VGVAAAAERSVAEEILETLWSNGQITEQQYVDLAAKARTEKTLPAVAAQEKPDTLRLYWKNGIRMDSADKQFKLKFGGRFMQDWQWSSEDNGTQAAVGKVGNNTEFRRARLYLAGLIYGRTKFKVQYDFAGGDADFKDLYLEQIKVPWVGNVRIGHFKEPYSLEELTSSKYLTFMERSIANFAPSRNSGIMLHNNALDQRLTWAVGGFRLTDGFGDSSDAQGSDSQYNVTARVTGLPLYQNEGEQLLHVGLSYSHQFRSDDPVRFRQRPEAHLPPYYVDTAAFLSDGVDLVTPELALVWGPASLQGEYTKMFVEGSSFDFDSYYVQGSYFLTGEHRKYKRTSGAFSRVSPGENFDMKGGLGAWEVAARYSWVDLDDNVITGGELDDITLGLNWHLNPNVRVMLNYIRADLDRAGDSDIFETRFQVDF
jgi:phosphate-selective porin OprO/OprP